MARGGSRPGAGRKRGAANAKTRAIADKAVAEGITPLEVMLDNMRFFYGEAGKLAQTLVMPDAENREGAAEALKTIMGARQAAQECAKDAAPYMHPRLATIEHGGKDGGPLVVEIVRFGEDPAAE